MVLPALLPEEVGYRVAPWASAVETLGGFSQSLAPSCANPDLELAEQFLTVVPALAEQGAPAVALHLMALVFHLVSPTVVVSLASEHSTEASSLVVELAGHLLQLVEEQVEETVLVAQAEPATAAQVELAIALVELAPKYVELAPKRKENEKAHSPLREPNLYPLEER